MRSQNTEKLGCKYQVKHLGSPQPHPCSPTDSAASFVKESLLLVLCSPSVSYGDPSFPAPHGGQPQGHNSFLLSPGICV